MIPQRISIKFFARSAQVDLAPFTPLFHNWIKQATVEGLLIDVADYKHVPDGPGIVLIGHDVDYGLDLNGGPGLLVLRKRFDRAQPLGDILRDTLRKAFSAAKAIEADPTTAVQFDLTTAHVSLIDRLVAPNTPESAAKYRPEIESVFADLYEASEISRGDADVRRNLTFVVKTASAGDVDELLDRIESRAGAAG